MGFDHLQANMHDWIKTVYLNKRNLLERADSEAALKAMSPGTSYIDETKRYLDILIYHLICPMPLMKSDSSRLKEATFIPGLEPTIQRYYKEKSKQNRDSGFLIFYHKDKDCRVGNPAGRIYINYDHTDLSKSVRIAAFLSRELKAQTRGIHFFKISGPMTHRIKRDSAVIYLTRRGMQTRDLLSETIEQLVALEPETHPGTQGIRRGIGFCHNPSRPEPGNWKTPYRGTSNSFGMLISAYLAHALNTSGPDLDDYADRIIQLLQEDGIDPMKIYNLSESTRYPG